MPQARLSYFSGTGNTRWVAERLGLGLDAAGYDVLLAEIAAPPGADKDGAGGRLSSGAPRDVELDVFLFPVYAFALPHVVRRALRKLPRVARNPAAVVAVFGDTYGGRPGRRRLYRGYAGGSLVEARRLLERRGYVPFASRAVGLPVSYTQLAPSPPPDEQAQILERAEAAVSAMAREFARKEGGHLSYPRANWLWNLPVRAAFRLLGRRVSGKLFVADARCAGCGTCARRCPVSAIRMRRGRPRWGWKCESCQRCINGCPRSAIQSSLPRTVLLGAATVLPYNRLFSLDSLWGRIGFLGEWGARGFWVGSWLACALLLLVVADLLLFAVEKPPSLRRVTAASLTRRYPRYRPPVARPRGRKA